MNREEKLRVLQELDNLPEEIYDDLLRALVVTTQQQLTELVVAVEQGQVQEIRNLIHSIRGATSNLRLHQLQAAVDEVRQAVHEGLDKDKIMKRVVSLQQTLDKFDQEIGRDG
jgi:HPt (histidine-containing phosphotransfer) domain-containing protein